MNAQEIRERRRQKILARAMAEQKNQTTPAEVKITETTVLQPQQPVIQSSIPEQKQPFLVQTPSQTDSSINVRQHVQQVLNRNKQNQKLEKYSKIAGLLLGLITGGQSSLLFLLMTIIVILFFSNKINHLSSLEKTQQNSNKKSQMQLINAIFSKISFITRAGKLILIMLCGYFLTIFGKIQLGLY